MLSPAKDGKGKSISPSTAAILRNLEDNLGCQCETGFDSGHYFLKRVASKVSSQEKHIIMICKSGISIISSCHLTSAGRIAFGEMYSSRLYSEAEALATVLATGPSR